MISIPSKSDIQASQLRDSLRVLAWNQYKIDNQVKGLEAYEEFAHEWQNHEIQQMNLKAIQKLIKDLGYSVDEMLQIRSEYYRKREQMNGNASVSVNETQEKNLDEIPY